MTATSTTAADLRALTGDIEGAIADFEFFAAWAEENGQFVDLVDQRQGWTDALRAGEDPFDEATLAALLDD